MCIGNVGVLLHGITSALYLLTSHFSLGLAYSLAKRADSAVEV